MLFLLLTLLVGTQARFLPREQIDLEDAFFEKDFESARPVYLRVLTPSDPRSRVVRQAHGVMNSNPDGSTSLMAKMPLAGGDSNKLSAVGGLQGAKAGGFGAVSGGLALDNINGHSASITGKHIPDFGNQLTAAGKLNLLHNDKHDLNANAFATRTFPNNPAIPNFNTVGGGLDYMYNNKVGASLGVAHTDLLKRTDYSAMGNLNVFRNPSSSLDFNAGYTKSVSPFLPNRNWEPSFGMTYSKYF